MSTSQVSRDLPFRIFTGAFFLIPWGLLAACGGSVGADETVEKAPAAGGDMSSGGTDNEGNQGSGGETAAAGSSTSLDDDLYVQISWQGREYRFTKAPPTDYPFSLSSRCAGQPSPAYYAGGACARSVVAACNEEGDCISIADNRLRWSLADGTNRLELAHEPSTFQPNYLATEESTHGPNGSRAVGTILIEADAVTLNPDEPIELPITGSYSACAAGGDTCAK